MYRRYNTKTLLSLLLLLFCSLIVGDCIGIENA